MYQIAYVWTSTTINSWWSFKSVWSDVNLIAASNLWLSIQSDACVSEPSSFIFTNQKVNKPFRESNHSNWFTPPEFDAKHCPQFHKKNEVNADQSSSPEKLVIDHKFHLLQADIKIDGTYPERNNEWITRELS